MGNGGDGHCTKNTPVNAASKVKKKKLTSQFSLLHDILNRLNKNKRVFEMLTLMLSHRNSLMKHTFV